MTNSIVPDHLNNMPSELSAADIELIDNFVRGKKRSIPQSGRFANAAARLQVEYSDNAMKLLDRRGGLVAVSKQVNEWQQKVLLNNQVEGYMTVLCATLERNDFLAARKSRHPDFVEYSKYQTPEGYQLQYQAAHIMGRSWLDRYARSSGVQSRGLLVFQGGSWYPIQELKIDQRTMQLRTLVGEVTVSSDEYIVWIEQLKDRDAEPSSIAKVKPQQPQGKGSQGTKIELDANETIYTEVDPVQELVAALETSTQTQTNPTPAMAANLNTEPNQENQAMTELLAAVKVKALKRLLDYVKNGEKVVITEVLRNGQDQIITTKTTEIQRGCPRWAIERIRGLSEI
jgi:tetrahydromethanopterin S-methyltransferase subunit B